MDIGDVQQRDIAERVELEQFVLGQPLLRRERGRAAADHASERRSRGADLKNFTASDHGMPRVIRPPSGRERPTEPRWD